MITLRTRTVTTTIREGRPSIYGRSFAAFGSKGNCPDLNSKRIHIYYVLACVMPVVFRMLIYSQNKWVEDSQAGQAFERICLQVYPCYSLMIGLSSFLSAA